MSSSEFAKEWDLVERFDNGDQSVKVDEYDAAIEVLVEAGELQG